MRNWLGDVSRFDPSDRVLVRSAHVVDRAGDVDIRRNECRDGHRRECGDRGDDRWGMFLCFGTDRAGRCDAYDAMHDGNRARLALRVQAWMFREKSGYEHVKVIVLNFQYFYRYEIKQLCRRRDDAFVFFIQLHYRYAAWCHTNVRTHFQRDFSRELLCDREAPLIQRRERLFFEFACFGHGRYRIPIL